MILVGSKIRVTQALDGSYLEDFIGKTGTVIGWTEDDEWYDSERLVKFDCRAVLVVYYEEMELIE